MGKAIDLAEENKKMGEFIREDVKDQISNVPDVYSEKEEWVSLREVGRTLELELFKILQMEFNWLQKTLKTKRGNDLCCVVLENFRGEFHQEDKKNEQISQHDPQINYECCLSKLQKDLEKNVDLRIDAFESGFINSRLKTIAKIWQGESDCTCVEKRLQKFKGSLAKEVGKVHCH